MKYQKTWSPDGEGEGQNIERKAQKGKSVKKQSSREKANSHDNPKTVVAVAIACKVPVAIR